MAPQAAIDLLRQNPLLSGLDERGLARLLDGSVTHVLPRGAVLFEEGAEAEWVHLLMSGRVALTATGGTDQATVIEVFGPGEMVVAPAAILGLPYLVGCQVTQDARVLHLQAAVLRRELDHQPRFARAMVDMLARHWRLLVELMTELKVRNSRTRLARFLARQAAQDGTQDGTGTVRLSEPKAMLARRLGMTPESLSRALAAMEASGAIAVSGQSITVRDAAALARHGEQAEPAGARLAPE